MPLVGSDIVSIVTCDADLSTCKAASAGGVSLFSSEYLLSGILRQQMDPESYPLLNNIHFSFKSYLNQIHVNIS